MAALSSRQQAPSAHASMNLINPRNPDREMMYFTPLGAGSEVGRSCHILRLDCGAHPAYSGLSALPFFDEIEPEEIDIILISHFHIDHCAALPYLTQRTTFRGRVFMTHPTKAIFKWMLSDYVRIASSSLEDLPFNEQDLQASYDRIEAIDFHQVVEVDGVRFSALNAGHVLGAAMFLVEIAGVKVLYTGDYSREEDRHLMSAESPGTSVDVLVCEATYGVQNHVPRAEREHRFTSLVHQIVARGGRCLVPMFALGRAQELMLILDEYWAKHPDLHHIPIYYASNLARKCMAVYQTYVNMMNSRIRKQFSSKNPFDFRYIVSLRNMASFNDIGPCVMLAAPAMLQSGLSRELLELWCPDKRNGVIIPGYVVEGTLGKHILSEPREITASGGAKLPLNCTVDCISFSAHVDFAQNREFIELVDPAHLILVHGETNMMTRLKNALHGLWAERDAARSGGTNSITASSSSNAPLIHAPKNAESVALYFKGEKYAKAVGKIAKTTAAIAFASANAAVAAAAAAAKVIEDAENEDPQQKEKSNEKNGNSTRIPGTSVIQGLVVAKDFRYHLVAVGELSEYTDLRPTALRQKQYIPLETATWELVLWHLQLVYADELEIEAGEPKPSALLYNTVRVSRTESRNELVIEWTGSPVADVLADSVLAVLLHVESAPCSVKLTNTSRAKCCHHAHDKENGCDVKVKVEDDDEVKVKIEESDFIEPKLEPEGADDVDKQGQTLYSFTPQTLEQANRAIRAKLIDLFMLNYNDVDTESQEDGTIIIQLDGAECRVNVEKMSVECSNIGLQRRVSSLVERTGNATSATWSRLWMARNYNRNSVQTHSPLLPSN